MADDRNEMTEDEIVKLLDDQHNLERAIVALYRRHATKRTLQTDEKVPARGFSAYDAALGKQLATWIMGGKALTGAYIDRARDLAKKYRSQLVAIVNENNAKRVKR